MNAQYSPTIAMLLLSCALIALSPAAAAADPCKADLPARTGAEFAGIVRYVADGESICVGPRDGDGSTWIEVQLADFNAAALNEAGGYQARAIAVRELMGRPIECIVVQGRGDEAARHDRVIAICAVNGRTAGAILQAASAPLGGH